MLPRSRPTEDECVPIRIEVCHHRLQWLLIRERSKIRDILPDANSFSNIAYNPYSLLDAEPGILLQLLDSEDVSGIKNMLARNIADFQHKYILGKFSSPSQIHECYIDYHNTKGFQALVTKSHVHIEFPLLDLSRLSCPDVEYLVKILEYDPVVIKFNFGISDGAGSASMHFPSILGTSRTVDFPSFSDNMSIRDYISLLENILSMRLSQRRNFVWEIRRIAALLEFDAVDFGYVSFALRMRNVSTFLLCIVELRLSGSFPESLPLVSVHDMASEISYPLATTVFSQVDRQQEGDVVARDMLSVIYKQIYKQSFR